MTMTWKDLIKYLALALAVILSGLQVFDWFTAPKVSLTAVVQYESFIWPGNFVSSYEGLKNSFSEDSLTEQIDWTTRLLDTFPDEFRTNVQNTIRLKFHRYAGEKLPRRLPDRFAYIKGSWSIALKNGTSQPVDSVDVVLPDGVVLLHVKREGDNVRIEDATSVLPIGRMRAGEKISIVAWTNHSSDHGADDIRIVHDGGTGDVTILRPVGALGQFWDRLPGFPVLILSLAILLIAFLGGGYFGYEDGWKKAIDHARSRGWDETDDDDEPPAWVSDPGCQ